MNTNIGEMIAKRDAELKQQKEDATLTALETFRQAFDRYVSQEIQQEISAVIDIGDDGRARATFAIDGLTHIIQHDGSHNTFFISVLNPDGSHRPRDGYFADRVDIMDYIVQLAAVRRLGRFPQLSPEASIKRLAPGDPGTAGTIAERIERRVYEIKEAERADAERRAREFHEQMASHLSEDARQQMGVAFTSLSDGTPVAKFQLDGHAFEIRRDSSIYRINVEPAGGAKGFWYPVIADQQDLLEAIVHCAVEARQRQS